LIVASFKDAFDFKSKKNINRQIEWTKEFNEHNADAIKS
jgi:hypothetical protein